MANKLLHDLLKVLPEFADSKLLVQHENITIQGIKLDSRFVTPGDLFIAYRGTVLDGRDYIEQAIKNGAKVILYESTALDSRLLDDHKDIIFIAVFELDKYISQIAAEFFNNPSSAQAVYAVTGTNGKTTCSFLLAQLLSLLNNNDIGLVGTVGYGGVNDIIANKNYSQLNNTTPDPIFMQQILAEFKQQNINHVALEASSHALDQQRLAAVNISTAIFTNLTHDHLDYHQSLENYFAAKKKLFYFSTVKNCVINSDDAFGSKLLEDLLVSTKVQDFKIAIYGFADEYKTDSNNSNIVSLFCKNVRDLKDSEYGLELELVLNDPDNNIEKILNVKTQLLGKFNSYNLMAVIASLYLNNYDLAEIQKYTDKLIAAPGRAEVFYCQDRAVSVIVDYAHTPDALEQILSMLRSQAKAHIWAVFGCGGDRDKSKRPIMGRIAAKYADYLIITDDNPRTEDPREIVKNIMSGIDSNAKNTRTTSKVVDIIHDRKQAISTALQRAKPGDIILVSGKGHEDYQIYGSKKIDYNEREFVRSLVN